MDGLEEFEISASKPISTSFIDSIVGLPDIDVDMSDEFEIPDNLTLTEALPIPDEVIVNVSEEETVEEVIEVQETKKEVVQEKEKETKPPWIFSLNDIPGDQELQITDIDHIYRYQHITTPSGRPTDKFLVFSKKENDIVDGEENWVTVSGVLSNRYSVSSIDSFIKELNNIVKITGEPVINTEHFRSSWRGAIDGTDGSVAISIHVTNSYDGSRSMRVDYTFENEDIDVDYFTLSRYSTAMVNEDNLINITSTLSDIHNQLSDTVNKLKEIEINDVIMKKLSKHFLRAEKKQFKELWEQSKPNSLYEALLITSITLDKNYTVDRYTKLRGEVDKLVANVF